MSGFLKMTLFVVVAVAMLAGFAFPPDASAGPLGFFGTSNIRSNNRADVAIARAGGVNVRAVHGQRVFIAPQGGIILQSQPRVFVDGFGRTVIIR